MNLLSKPLFNLFNRHVVSSRIGLLACPLFIYVFKNTTIIGNHKTGTFNYVYCLVWLILHFELMFEKKYCSLSPSPMHTWNSLRVKICCCHKQMLVRMQQSARIFCMSIKQNKNSPNNEARPWSSWFCFDLPIGWRYEADLSHYQDNWYFLSLYTQVQKIKKKRRYLNWTTLKRIAVEYISRLWILMKNILVRMVMQVKCKCNTLMSLVTNVF